MSTERQPVLAVVATPGTTDRLRPLARELASRVDLCSLDQVHGVPDGVLAASVDALRGASPVVPVVVPVVVWVDHAGEMASLAEHDVVAYLSVDRPAIDAGAIAVPPDALDTLACPVVPPLVRARLRARDALLPGLTVVVTEAWGDATPPLAEAAAAVVTGPMLATALALGTPTVTTQAEADRLGLRAGAEVEVAGLESGEALAQAIAADDVWAARLSLAGRRFAERALAIGPIADVVLERLGLVAPRSGPRASLDQRLAELATPSTARIRARAAAAAECFAARR